LTQYSLLWSDQLLFKLLNKLTPSNYSLLSYRKGNYTGNYNIVFRFSGVHTIPVIICEDAASIAQAYCAGMSGYSMLAIEEP
jgi:hypothetical protein